MFPPTCHIDIILHTRFEEWNCCQIRWPQTGWLEGRQADWKADRLIGRQTGWLEGRQADWKADRLTGRQTGWLEGIQADIEVKFKAPFGQTNPQLVCHLIDLFCPQTSWSKWTKWKVNVRFAVRLGAMTAGRQTDRQQLSRLWYSNCLQHFRLCLKLGPGKLIWLVSA